MKIEDQVGAKPLCQVQEKKMVGSPSHPQMVREQGEARQGRAKSMYSYKDGRADEGGSVEIGGVKCDES